MCVARQPSRARSIEASVVGVGVCMSWWWWSSSSSVDGWGGVDSDVGMLSFRPLLVCVVEALVAPTHCRSPEANEAPIDHHRRTAERIPSKINLTPIEDPINPIPPRRPIDSIIRAQAKAAAVGSDGRSATCLGIYMSTKHVSSFFSPFRLFFPFARFCIIPTPTHRSLFSLSRQRTS